MVLRVCQCFPHCYKYTKIRYICQENKVDINPLFCVTWSFFGRYNRRFCDVLPLTHCFLSYFALYEITAILSTTYPNSGMIRSSEGELSVNFPSLFLLSTILEINSQSSSSIPVISIGNFPVAIAIA